MLDTLPPLSGSTAFPGAASAPTAAARWDPGTGGWLSAALDEVDYGILVLVDEIRVVHANRTARRELAEGHPLLLRGPFLGARRPADEARLGEMLAAAARRRLRRFALFGSEEDRVSASFVPLDGAAGGASATLMVLGKRQVCETLTIEAYARAHGLTPAETRVLAALCRGDDPGQAAQLIGVALSTVRTQIGNIRAKTGARSIRLLVREIAVLPPLMGLLA